MTLRRTACYNCYFAAAAHWFNNTSSKFIARRRSRLQHYLDDLVELLSSGLVHLPEVQDFFGVRSAHVLLSCSAAATAALAAWLTRLSYLRGCGCICACGSLQIRLPCVAMSA